MSRYFKVGDVAFNKQLVFGHRKDQFSVRLKWLGGVVQPDLNTLGGGMVAFSPSSQLLCSATPASRKMGGQGSRCTAAACAPAPGSGPPRTLHAPRTLRAASEAADGTLLRIDFAAAIST